MKMGSSPLENINAAIKNTNPFQTLAIVRDQDVWDGSFPDVETVNAHASDAVYQALEQVRNATSARNKITSMVVIAARGVGKSHIISRLRRRLQVDGSGLFVYAGVEKYALNSINYEFQQTLAESFDRIGTQGVTQWQELATYMANQVWKAGNPNAKIYTAKNLVTQLNSRNQAEINRLVELVTDKFIAIPRTKRIDPDIVRAIFWTLSESHALYATKWLAGKDLSEKKSSLLELPNSSTDLRNPESKAFDNLQQILSLVTDYKTLLICFDELDLPDNRRSNAGLALPHVVARLIKTLIDSVSLSSVSQGIVILTVMMPDTWQNKVKQMPGGVPDRISANEPINLNYLDGESIVELVKLWLTKFYQQNNLHPPTPVYPFEKDELLKLGSKNSVREVLKWCYHNFKVIIPPPPPSPVEAPYQKELAAIDSSSENWLEDDNKLATALFIGFRALEGKVINEVKIESVDKNAYANSSPSGCVNFKIVTNKKGKNLAIGIAVFQNPNSKVVLSALKHLVEYSNLGNNRICLIRSRKVSSGAKKCQEYLRELLTSPLSGIWVKLTPEDIKPLAAIFSVYKGKGDYNLKSQQILDFVVDKELAMTNSIIQGILSEPTGTIPEGLTDD